MKDRFQLVWWRDFSDWSLHFIILPPDRGMALVYVWSFQIGPLEVRRWLPVERRASALAAYHAANK